MIVMLGLSGCVSGPRATKPADTQSMDAIWQQYRTSDTARNLLAMLDQKAIVVGEDTMPLHIELIWDQDTPQPDAGYPVFISMHGGGAFTEEENHEQWEIQFTRYPGVRGLYVCPHSPMDTWDQWHHQRIFDLIDALVRALMLREDVDPNRIYLNGYCSGGNGVYQLAPLMADRFAAASATKAISEGAPIENLRNLPIDLQWGEHDRETLNRPEHNRANVENLLAMQRNDPAGYAFRDVEHWRQGKVVNDKSTMLWMSRYTRDPYPQRVVWHQDGDARPESNPPRHRMYWLGVDDDYEHDGIPDIADARIEPTTNTIYLTTQGYDRLTLFLSENMIDLDQPIHLVVNGRPKVTPLVDYIKASAHSEMIRRGDPAMVFHATLSIDLAR